MNIFAILQEAKKPTPTISGSFKVKFPSHNTTYGVALEDTKDDEEDIAVDYTEGSSDEEEEVESEDEEEEAVDYTEDASDEEISVNDEDSEEEDAVDYTDGVDSDSGDETEETEEVQDDDTPPMDDNMKSLMNDSVQLYHSIRTNIDRLDEFSQSDIVTNKIVIQVKKNLSELLKYVYVFITTKFSTNTYVQNLYTYNYFIEGYKINVELLKKISVLR